MDYKSGYYLFLHLLVDKVWTKEMNIDAIPIIDLLAFLSEYIITRLLNHKSSPFNEYAGVDICELFDKSSIENSNFNLKQFIDYMQNDAEDKYKFVPLSEKDESFLTINYYDRKKRLLLLLQSADIGNTKGESLELFLKNKYTIEHIVPQSAFSSEDAKCWKQMFCEHNGKNEEKAQIEFNIYVHTLGNFILLTQNINSSISNKCYKDKANSIINETSIALNKDVIYNETTQNEWYLEQNRKHYHWILRGLYKNISSILIFKKHI